MAGVTTGTSVLGIAFEGGVMVAADMLVSYGSMARFRDCDRILKVNEQTVVAGSGDYADFQFISDLITQKQIDEEQWEDGSHLKPAQLHSWLSRVAYNRRSKFEPLWCSYIVGGLQENENGKKEPYLGFVDKLGTTYKANAITTGLGQYLATPLFREFTESSKSLPTEQQARDLINKCMEVLYYRDARSLPKFKLVIIKTDGVKVEGPIQFKGNWQLAHNAGYGGM